jgi:hypothetical protein
MCCLVLGIQAAEAENGFVHVNSDTIGVEKIVAIDLDFHITTTNVPDSFCAEVYVSSIGYTFSAPRPTVDKKKKIDLFFSMLNHELVHARDMYFDQGMFWAPRELDTDGDRLPDRLDDFDYIANGDNIPEYTIEHNPEYYWKGDWEYRARKVEGVSPPSEKDWSKEGKQW